MNSKKGGLLIGLIISGFLSAAGFIIGTSLITNVKDNSLSPNNTIPIFHALFAVFGTFVYLAFAAGFLFIILFIYLVIKLFKFNKTLISNSTNKPNGPN